MGRKTHYQSTYSDFELPPLLNSPDDLLFFQLSLIAWREGPHVIGKLPSSVFFSLLHFLYLKISYRFKTIPQNWQSEEYVLKQAPKFQHERLQRREVHQYLFENNPYKDAQINNVISDLLQLLYQFLAYLHYEYKEAAQKNFLLEELLEREFHQDFDLVAKSYQRVQEKIGLSKL